MDYTLYIIQYTHDIKHLNITIISHRAHRLLVKYHFLTLTCGADGKCGFLLAFRL